MLPLLFNILNDYKEMTSLKNLVKLTGGKKSKKTDDESDESPQDIEEVEALEETPRRKYRESEEDTDFVYSSGGMSKKKIIGIILFVLLIAGGVLGYGYYIGWFNIKPTVILCVDNNYNAYFANTNILTTPNWTKLNMPISYLSIAKGTSFSCYNGSVYYNSNVIANGNWTRLPEPKAPPSPDGSLTSVSIKMVSYDVMKSIIVAYDNADNIYYADTTIDTKPNWTVINLPTVVPITSICCSNGKIFCVTKTHIIYYNSDYTTTNWQEIPSPTIGNGKVTQVSYDGVNNILIACDTAGNTLFVNQNLITKTPGWTLMNVAPSNITSVNYFNNSALCLSTISGKSTINYNSSYSNMYFNTWSTIPLPTGMTSLKQVIYG